MSRFIKELRSLGLNSILFALPLFALPLLAGCGDSRPPTGELVGTVSNGDERVGDCVVSLYDPTTKRSSGAKVDNNGEFQIKELLLGNYEITVFQRTTGEATNEPFDKRIPAKYRNRKKSLFSVTIEEGKNSVELKMTP